MYDRLKNKIGQVGTKSGRLKVVIPGNGLRKGGFTEIFIHFSCRQSL